MEEVTHDEAHDVEDVEAVAHDKMVGEEEPGIVYRCVCVCVRACACVWCKR